MRVAGGGVEGRMNLRWRWASVEDAALLGRWNGELIRDEGHRSQASAEELTERMQGWLRQEYRGLVYLVGEQPVGYALYRLEAEGTYLRHFFICADQRRRGYGREALRVLREEVWPKGKRVSVVALCRNAPALAFWRALGFGDYCLTLEMEPA